MFDFAYLQDKEFVVILVDDDGSKEAKWSVLIGIAKWRDGHLSIYRGEDIPEFPIPDDTLDRVKPVPGAVREMLKEADYCTILTIGPPPKEANLKDLTHTGLTLPSDEKDIDQVD